MSGYTPGPTGMSSLPYQHWPWKIERREHPASNIPFQLRFAGFPVKIDLPKYFYLGRRMSMHP